jgi:hypothetical protein
VQRSSPRRALFTGEPLGIGDRRAKGKRTIVGDELWQDGGGHTSTLPKVDGVRGLLAFDGNSLAMVNRTWRPT